jgi:hypothetical protein
MSLTLNPNGLSFADYIGGKPRYSAFDFPLQSAPGANTPGHNIGNGDVVSLTGGYVVNSVAATAIVPGSSAQLILGVFNSVKYQPSQQNVSPGTFPYWVAGTTTANAQDAAVSVCTDPSQVYIVQANGAVPQSYIGRNFNLGGFNSTSSLGQSAIYLDVTTVTTQNWGQVKLIGLAPVTPAMESNAWGDSYTWVKVTLNNTVLHAGQYGVV